MRSRFGTILVLPEPHVEKERTGDRVGGYRVVRRLAIGGTSEVLLAKAEGPHGFERSVVLKLLLSQYKNDADFKAMFAREAAAYARLAHPAIVRLYDFFAHGEQLVMVLEYIDGPALSRLRGMLKAVGQQIDDATGIYIASCVFDALAAAHAASDEAGEPAPVIHRDVNPSNVLIPWDGHVKLADFGIAKVTGVSHESRAGLIKGTYGYMAPEQVKGESVTPRADVYAAGIILWELLSKRRAFLRGALPEIEVLRAMAEPHIVSLDVLRPDVDKNVREALKRALEPRAGDRKITAEEMVATLRAVVPADEGRERLARTLAAVRHEPKPAPTTMPPPLGTPGDPYEDEATGKIVPKALAPRPAAASDRGMLPRKPTPPPMPAAPPRPIPRVTPPPRPAAGVPRTTAAYGESSGAPLPPAAAPPRIAMPATEPLPSTLTPSDLAPGGAAGARAAAPPAARDDDAPSSDGPSLVGSSKVGRMFDSLVEPAELVRSTGRDSEKLRLGTPLAGIAPGKPLSEAIDEILGTVPSSLAPSLAPSEGASGEPPTMRDARDAPGPGAGEEARELGRLPAAPPPLQASLPTPFDLSTQAMATDSRALPSSFPAMNKTLAMDVPPVTVPRDARVPAVGDAERVEAGVERSSGQASLGQTAPLASPGGPRVGPPPLPGSAPSTAKMRAFAAAGAGGGGAPATASGPPPLTQTLASPGASVSASPSPLGEGGTAPAPPTGAGSSAAPRGASSSLSGAHASISEPPARRSGLATAVVLGALAGLATAAGLGGYSRWQKTRAAVRPAAATATAVTIPAASAPASASASASPVASASASPVASASASASAPVASASASSDVPADVPANSGRVLTTNAAPGRRIFVDDRTVGQTPEAVIVKCGSRAIRLGSTGFTQTVDVPCGGEVTIGDR